MLTFLLLRSSQYAISGCASKEASPFRGGYVFRKCSGHGGGYASRSGVDALPQYIRRALRKDEAQYLSRSFPAIDM